MLLRDGSKEPHVRHAVAADGIRIAFDLFLDLWIAPDGKHVILDEDEFEEAISLGHLMGEQIDHARRVLQELVEATQRGGFPPAVVRDFRI